MNTFLGAIGNNKNVRTIDLFIEGESKVNLIKRTPTLRDLFTASQLKELKDGKNRLRVNNYVYSKLQNFDFMYVKKID
jgi:cytochrome c553